MSIKKKILQLLRYVPSVAPSHDRTRDLLRKRACESLASDWRAVGDDLRKAMERFDNDRK